MKKKFRNIFLVALVAITGVTATMYSCSKESILPNEQMSTKTTQPTPDDPILAKYCGEMSKKALISQRGHSIGNAYIYNNGKNLYVHLIADANTYFGNAYLELKENPEDFPLTIRNTPDYLHFSVVLDGLATSKSRKFVIPLEQVRNKKYFSAVVKYDNTRAGRYQYKAWVEGRAYPMSAEGQVVEIALQNCKARPHDFPEEHLAKPELIAIPRDRE